MCIMNIVYSASNVMQSKEVKSVSSGGQTTWPHGTKLSQVWLSVCKIHAGGKIAVVSTCVLV